MDEETKEHIFIAVGGLVGFFIVAFAFCWFVGYMMQQEDDARNDEIASYFYYDDKYYLVVESDFLSGNECLFMFTAKLFNKTDGELISRYDGYYDVCDERLLDNKFKEVNDKIAWR